MLFAIVLGDSVAGKVLRVVIWFVAFTFYAQIRIDGVPADTTMKKIKTLEDNWIPAWNEEFEFPLTVLELALLRVEVDEYDMSKKDDFKGQTCLPVFEIRRGIKDDFGSYASCGSSLM